MTSTSCKAQSGRAAKEQREKTDNVHCRTAEQSMATSSATYILQISHDMIRYVRQSTRTHTSHEVDGGRGKTSTKSASTQEKKSARNGNQCNICDDVNVLHSTVRPCSTRAEKKDSQCALQKSRTKHGNVFCNLQTADFPRYDSISSSEHAHAHITRSGWGKKEIKYKISINQTKRNTHATGTNAV